MCDWYFSIVGVVVLEKADVCLSDVPLLFQAYVSWFQVGVNSKLHMGPCGQWRAVEGSEEEERGGGNNRMMALGGGTQK